MIADAGVMSLPTVIMIGAVLGGLEGATRADGQVPAGVARPIMAGP